MGHYKAVDFIKASKTRKRLLGGALIGAFLTLQTGQATAAPLDFKVTAYKQAVAEGLGGVEGIASFYRARDFAPIWTGDDADSRRAGLP